MHSGGDGAEKGEAPMALAAATRKRKERHADAGTATIEELLEGGGGREEEEGGVVVVVVVVDRGAVKYSFAN